MREDLLELYRTVTNLCRRVHVLQRGIREEVEAERDCEIGTDTVHVMKLCCKMMKRTRIDLEETQNHLERIVCLKYIEDGRHMEGNSKPIHGEIATGTPDVKQVPSIPSFSKDKERYVKFLMDYGVPRELAESGLVRAKWPDMKDYVASQIAKGEEVSDAINLSKSRPEYQLKTRGRGDIADVLK